ncbi:hypothetical protein LSM04_007773 [Trypanosoma melophagium]|uniref:uncharacterized protein n=1 Tax=Trypanosoma melophagium TaxID=715481 RepID=UPI00351A0AB3|nr:hypothetical protein LSM04_007773 [Trypanosoma melophagium]
MKWGNAHEALYTIVRERSLSHDTASVERSRRGLSIADEGDLLADSAVTRSPLQGPVGARSGAATSTRDGLEVVQCVTCAAVSERPLSRRSSLAAPQSVVTSIQEQEQEQHKGEGVAERKASGEMKWGNAHEALYTIVRERSLSHDTASVERSRRGLSIADEGDLLADSAVTRSPLQGPVGARSGAATSTRDGLEVVQCVTCAAVSERPLSRRSSLAAPQSVVTSIQEQEQEQHKGEALYTIVRERSLSHDTASVERSRRGLSIADEGDLLADSAVTRSPLQGPVGARSGAATSTRDGLEVVQCVTCAAVSERPLSRRSSLAAPQSVVTSIQEQEQEQHKGEGVAERKASGEMKWGNAHEALYTIVRERSLSHDTASVERSRRGLSIADEGDLLADSAVTRSPLQGPVGARSGAATSTRDGLEVVQCVTCAAVSERPLSRRSSLAAPQSVVTSIQEQEQEQHKGRV